MIKSGNKLEKEGGNQPISLKNNLNLMQVVVRTMRTGQCG
jgi:hypothetical protein